MLYGFSIFDGSRSDSSALTDGVTCRYATINLRWTATREPGKLLAVCVRESIGACETSSTKSSR